MRFGKLTSAAGLCVLLAAVTASIAGEAPRPMSTIDSERARLAAEVHATGWIAFGARSNEGDWDLFLCRPDGSSVRPLTRSPEFNEFLPQFSRDGRQLLYRRISNNETIDGNRHGEQGSLIVANSDGSDPRVLGKPGELPWASWSSDGRQIACLSIKGILFVELATGKLIRTLPRKGFFQQTTWSPDGKWLCGVANSYGTGWSIARMNVATGEVTPVNTVDCCTPDWFPDSQQVIFSWRPPGQKANHGQGWTQLWRSDADRRNRQLVYGEDGRHVYGAHISPDGQYVLFTGNMHEDGDPGNAGAPMSLMRLRDAPIIGGESKALRALHPRANDGPFLTLPAGWEPAWTARDMVTRGNIGVADSRGRTVQSSSEKSGELARELHENGWLVFSAKRQRGDWDLFLMRPDGSNRRSVTDTPDFNEAAARFSPDGTRLLYYRMPRSEPVDNNTYGTFELVITNTDGTQPVTYGAGYHWASWGPSGREIACLTPKGIQIVDLASRVVIRQFTRKGMVSQLVWSPDGKSFIGTANGLGQFWNIGCLDPETQEIKALSETQRYNCTPDWMPDSKQVVYARGIVPQEPGHAELWTASTDGTTRRQIYVEARRHIYGACPSPDGQYVVFTRSAEDLGKVSDIEIAIIRWPQPVGAPNEGGVEEASLPTETPPVRLDLGPGWEPHWTRIIDASGGTEFK